MLFPKSKIKAMETSFSYTTPVSYSDLLHIYIPHVILRMQPVSDTEACEEKQLKFKSC